MKNIIRKLIFFPVWSLLLIILFSPFNDGCKNHNTPNKSYSGCGIQLENRLKSPLTYEKYAALINSTDSMSWFVLDYFYYSSGITKLLYIDGGRIDINLYFNSINSFVGNYFEGNTNTSPVSDNSFHANFTQEEMQVLFDYLGQNSTYFFNSSEYEGLSIPYESLTDVRVCRGNFVFALGFFEPMSHTEVWAISKCLDEYPSQEHPLYGLFQLLENNFISQFEEP